MAEDPVDVALSIPEVQAAARVCYGDMLGATFPLKVNRDLQINLKSIYQDGIYEVMTDYLDFEKENVYDLLYCWILGTYCYEIFGTFPYIYFSGIKRSGKSRALDIMRLLSKNGKSSLNASPAALFRLLGETRASFFFDELENLNKEGMEDLKLLLQAGYRRGGTVLRCEKNEETGKIGTKEFAVYCPKAIASINRPDDVLADRSLVITMMRSMNWEVSARVIPDEKVMLPSGFYTWAFLKDLIEKIVLSKMDEIKKEYESLTDKEITSRDWEMYRPLLAICKVALGGDYYDRLRLFALERIKEKKEEEQFNLEAMILPALYSLSDNYNGRVPATQLLVKIKQDDTYSWVNGQFLGRVLRNIGFKPIKSSGLMYWICPKDKIELFAQRLSIKLEDNKEE